MTHNTDGLPSPGRIGQQNPADASSMSRVSHHVFLLLAFSWRNPCLRRVVRLFSVVYRFWTQETGTFWKISLPLLSDDLGLFSGYVIKLIPFTTIKCFFRSHDLLDLFKLSLSVNKTHTLESDNR